MKVCPLMALEPPTTLPRGTGIGLVCWVVAVPTNVQLCGESAARATRLIRPQPYLYEPGTKAAYMSYTFGWVSLGKSFGAPIEAFVLQFLFPSGLKGP